VQQAGPFGPDKELKESGKTASGLLTATNDKAQSQRLPQVCFGAPEDSSRCAGNK
jgi:hypothetical protein